MPSLLVHVIQFPSKCLFSKSKVNNFTAYRDAGLCMALNIAGHSHHWICMLAEIAAEVQIVK